MTDRPPPAAASGLERRIAAGTAWSFLGILSERLVAFVVFVLVVRNLSPAEVGIVTLAVVFIDLSLILTQGGMPEAIIRHEAPDETTFDTAFWTTVGLGAAMTAALCLAAGPIADFYATPALETVLYVLSAAFVTTALGAVHGARLTRAFRFRAVAARSMTATLVGGAAAVALSVAGYGLWALVVQRLATVALSTVFVWVAARWTPRLRFDRRQFGALAQLGVRLSMTTVVLQLTSSLTLLIIGAVMSNAVVGYYRVASRLFDVVVQFAVGPVSQVALASFAAVQSDPARLTALYARLTGAVSMISVAGFLALAALAEPLVRLTFGAEWTPSAPLLSIMCLVALPLCVNQFVHPLLTARGRGGDVLRFGLLQLSLSAAFTAVAAPFGAAAVAAAYAARGYAVLPYALRLTARHGGMTAAALLGRAAAPAAAAALMAAALFAAQRYVFPAYGPVGKLLACIPLGIAVYAVGILVLARPRLRELRETATLIRQQAPGKAAAG
ncbi:MAG: lipopolysaccharide biosynthesis protein [Rhodospirillales bacterium]